MSLTDLMSNADLSVYPQVALVIFLGVFLVVSLRVMSPRNKSALEDHASMALEDDACEQAERSQA